MDAYVEWWCEHAGMVRVGPEAIAYGDPYVFSAGVKVTGEKRAEITGTHAPEGGITHQMTTAIRLCFRRIGWRIKMQRRRPGRPVCEVCEHKLG